MMRKFLIIGSIICGTIGLGTVFYIREVPNPKYCIDEEIFATPKKTWLLLRKAFRENDLILYWKCRGKKPKQIELSHLVDRWEIVKIGIYGSKNQLAYILWKPIKDRYSEKETRMLKKQGWLKSSYFEKINGRWVYVPESFYLMVKETLDWLKDKVSQEI